MAHNHMTFDATENQHPTIHNLHHHPQQQHHQHQQEQQMFSLHPELGAGLDQQAGLVTAPNPGALPAIGLHPEHYPPSVVDQQWPPSTAGFSSDPADAFLDYNQNARRNMQQQQQQQQQQQSKPASNTTASTPAPPTLDAQSSADKGQALDPSKVYHPEWGVTRDQDFHPLTLKHQRDLENLFQAGNSIPDFYFWQANLGGYCMADMLQNIVVSSEGTFPLVRRMVEGAPHPGRRTKKKNGMG